MRTGQLRHRIAIEEAVETQSASGEPQREWITFAERWAEIVPRQSREFSAAMQISSEVSFLIRIRGFLDVNELMRVAFEGRHLDIVAAYGTDGRSPLNASEVLLACKEGLSHGS